MAKRGQGKPAGLSRDQIAIAAVELIDQVGLEAFGVRPLAAKLGVDPMSIYNHVKGKSALLDAATEAVVAEATAVVADWPEDWIGIARTMADGYRSTAVRHPRVFPLLATRAQTSVVALDALERLTDAMRRQGLADQTVADAPMIIFSFLNGYLLAVLDTDTDTDTDQENRNPTPRTQPELDPEQFPTMAALAPLQAGYGSDAEFERLLETVLAGTGAGDTAPPLAQRGKSKTTTARPARKASARRSSSAGTPRKS